VVYDLASQTQRAPVSIEGGRIQFMLSSGGGQRVGSIVVEGNKWTSTATDNANVDIWEKVP